MLRKITMSAVAAAVMVSTMIPAAPAEAIGMARCLYSSPTVGTIKSEVGIVYDEIHNETYVAVQPTPKHGTILTRNPNGRWPVRNKLWLDTSATYAINSRGKQMKKVRTVWTKGNYAFVMKGKISKVRTGWKVYQLSPKQGTIEYPFCMVKN